VKKPTGILHVFSHRRWSHRSYPSVRNPSKRTRHRSSCSPDLEFTIAPYRDNLTTR
jgi:hypothetical protein